MTLYQPVVNRAADAERHMKTSLTLSAVGALAQRSDGAPSAPEHHPHEALIRDERDPFVWTETELRLAWGDR